MVGCGVVNNDDDDESGDGIFGERNAETSVDPDIQQRVVDTKGDHALESSKSPNIADGATIFH